MKQDLIPCDSKLNSNRQGHDPAVPCIPSTPIGPLEFGPNVDRTIKHTELTPCFHRSSLTVCTFDAFCADKENLEKWQN